MVTDRNATTRACGMLVLANAAVALAIGVAFVDAQLAGADAAGRLFLLAAVVGQTGALCLLCGLPLLLLSRLANGSRWVALAAPPVFTALQVALYIDLIVYEMFRFHLNGLVLNLLTTPGGFEAMRLSRSDGLVFAAVCAGGLLGQSVLLELLRTRGVGVDRACARKPWLALTAIVLAALVWDRTVYGYADLRGDTTLTRLARPVPLYLPVTFKRAASRWLGVETDRDRSVVLRTAGSTLRYPRRTLETVRPDRLHDIVWVVLDSWRHDAFTRQITPRIHDFAQRAVVFDRHRATGNATRFGIFGMFYGLHGLYWHQILAEQRGPVLVDRLLELGYDFKVITPSPLTFPEFRRTVFVDLRSSLVDDLPGATLLERHEQTVATFERFVGQVAVARTTRADGAAKPFFSFMFFDSTHAPYDFPEDHAPFKPYAREVRYAGRNLDAQREPILNRYRNAISWLDVLSGRVIDALESSGLLDDAIVVITGDHGEEFGEHGLWGHNSAFNDEQIHVPFVLHLPGRAHARLDHATSHQDIAPTFMELLGVGNPPADYANGRSLFDTASDRRLVACGWSECAWIHDDGYVVFGTSGGNSFDLEIRDRDYRVVTGAERDRARRPHELARLAGDLGRFLAP